MWILGGTIIRLPVPLCDFCLWSWAVFVLSGSSIFSWMCTREPWVFCGSQEPFWWQSMSKAAWRCQWRKERTPGFTSRSRWHLFNNSPSRRGVVRVCSCLCVAPSVFSFRCSVSFSSAIATPSVGTWLDWLQLWASMDPTPWSRLRSVWLNRLCQPSRLLVLTVLCLQVDHWLEFSAQRLCGQPGLSVALAELDRALSLRTFLVGRALTLADISVWASLKGAFLDLFWWPVCVFTQLFHAFSCCCCAPGHVEWPSQGESFPHVSRWFCFLNSQVPFSAVGNKYAKKSVPLAKSSVSVLSDVCLAGVVAARLCLVCAELHHSVTKWTNWHIPDSASFQQSDEKKQDVGKFVDLPGAEMGKVVVRFPPEASG